MKRLKNNKNVETLIIMIFEYVIKFFDLLSLIIIDNENKVEDSYMTILNSNLHYIQTNNKYELIETFINNYIESHINELIECNSIDRLGYLQDKIVVNN